MTDLPPQVQLTQMITGIVLTQSIYVAAELGLADHLVGGPRSVDDLAGATSTHARSLRRLLRTLASLGIFAEDEQGRFGLTPMAELLAGDHPSHVRDMARMIGGDHAKAWIEMLHSVRTGEPAFDHVFGKPIFDYLDEHPEAARIFDGAMTGFHGPETPATIEAYDFSGFDTIIDIGGGNASVLLEVLRANPNLKGIVFDLPHVAEHAAGIIAASDCADRCRVEGGSFFDAVTPGADCCMMRHILHDWDDEKSIAILNNCRKAMGEGGTVLVVESVIPPGNEPHPGKMLDLVMLVIPGGYERTEAEFEALFDAAGLKINRIVPTASPVSVIEGAAR